MCSDLKIIWILSLILLVIILFTGITTCSSPVLYNRFIDRKYQYISEPFSEIENTKNNIINKNKEYIISNMDKMVFVKENEKKIRNLTSIISELETKLNHMI
jgi:hypothetical protein